MIIGSRPALMSAIVLAASVMTVQPVFGAVDKNRRPIYEGVKGQVIGRTQFAGEFKYARDGVGGVKDEGAKEGQKIEDADVGVNERMIRMLGWHGVLPDGTVVQADVPEAVVKGLYARDHGDTGGEFGWVPEAGQHGLAVGEKVGSDGGAAMDEKYTAARQQTLRTAKGRDAAAAEDGTDGADGATLAEKIAARLRGASATAILGADTRWEVSPASWRPAKHAGQLTFSGGFCSAVLIGPKHILTAGHCVHAGGGGDWFGNFRFYPGRSRAGGSAPYGSYSWRRAWTYRGWTEDGSSDHDFALIELSSEPGIGWLSFGWSSAMSTSWLMYHKGYSGDKPYGTQWSTSDAIRDVWTNRFYTDDSDTVGGNSGGPWYRYVNGNAVVYGTHSGWNQYWWWWGAKRNRHTRITAAKFGSLCDWIDDARVC